MLVKELETEHFYFDFRHPDENDTVKIHFHFKSKNNGQKTLGEKAGGLIVSPNAIQDIHVGKKYQKFFDEVYNYRAKLRKYCKKYLKKNKRYKPSKDKINGFIKENKQFVKRERKLRKVYIQFMHPNGDDSIALKFLIKKKGDQKEIGFANISTIGIKELHLNPEFEIYFDYIYGKRERLTEYARKCANKNNEFLRKMRIDVNLKQKSMETKSKQPEKTDRQK